MSSCKGEKMSNASEHIPWILCSILAFFIFMGANSVLQEMMGGILLIVGFLASIFVRLGNRK